MMRQLQQSADDGLTRPELVFGLVGALGVDIDAVQSCLMAALRQVEYLPHLIHLTQLMPILEIGKSTTKRRDDISHKISRANAICERLSDNSILSALAISEIRSLRGKEQSQQGASQQEIQLEGHAYIIRQLKRVEEVDLLRAVYRKKFIQVSVALDKEARISAQKNRISRDEPGLKPAQCAEKARSLIEQDEEEEGVDYGQRVRKIFHLGDVFISGSNLDTIESTINRFVFALFGKNNISPTRDEYGAYLAKGASLTSIDLSRQVGAAITSKEGDIVALGCNEVPKSGGGNYWSDDSHRARDYEIQTESNKVEVRRIIYDFVANLRKNGIIQKDRSVEEVLSDERTSKAIEDALISDITEYGRMTHAEMSAICDAARLGRSTRDSTMHVTTFPCHNCAKHIVSAGIQRVVYIEPYPKSRAGQLHEDSISIGVRKRGTVLFEHFIGISPRRYRDIFEKSRRRGVDGTIQEWYEGFPRPRVDDFDPTHLRREAYAVEVLQKALGN